MDIRNNHQSSNRIYVLLTDTGTMFTRLIKGFTNAPYNHASLVLDENLNEVYSFGRKAANNPLVAGFVHEDVYEGTFSYFPGTRCVLIRLDVTKQQQEAVTRIIRDFEQQQQQYRYNLIGLVGILLKLDLQPANAYFCSQFVAETLRSSGLKLWDCPSTRVTPHDFLLHDQFEAVYEGRLYDYPLLEAAKLSAMRRAGGWRSTLANMNRGVKRHLPIVLKKFV